MRWVFLGMGFLQPVVCGPLVVWLLLWQAGVLSAQASVVTAHLMSVVAPRHLNIDPAAVAHGLSFPWHVRSSPTGDKNPYLMLVDRQTGPSTA